MENMGAFLDTEWESICKLLSVEEPDISSHLLDYSPPASVQDDNLSFITPFNFSYDSGQSLMGDYSEENYVNVNVFADNVLFGMSCCNDLPVLDDVSLGLLLVEDARNEIDDGSDLNSANQSSCNTELTFKRKLDKSEVQDKIEVKTTKKKARVSRANARKGKRKVQAKKDDEEIPTACVEEERDGALDNSEDESHEESNEVAEPESNQTTGLTSTGKKRANRGAATDPQSLYARKRRMRINERLRTLQNLVPNGTKVDISTMLDEAFHYVKFLELQMRLLSSDDMWMFAPFVYNGFDVGRLSPFMAL